MAETSLVFRPEDGLGFLLAHIVGSILRGIIPPAMFASVCLRSSLKVRCDPFFVLASSLGSLGFFGPGAVLGVGRGCRFGRHFDEWGCCQGPSSCSCVPHYGTSFFDCFCAFSLGIGPYGLLNPKVLLL